MPPPEDPTPPPAPKYQLKPKVFVPVNDPIKDVMASPEHNVYTMRAHERDIEQAGGRDDLAEPAPVRYRRRRDYAITLALINGTGLPVMIYGFKTANPFLIVCGLVGAVMGTLAVTWVMWFLLDRY